MCDKRLRACVCKKGWTGDACDVKDCGGTIRKLTSQGLKFVVECSGHGSCSSDHTCACSDGWGGSDCAKELCPHGCNGERGECKAVGNAAKSCQSKTEIINGKNVSIYGGPSCSELTRAFCSDNGEGRDGNCDRNTGACSDPKIH